MDTGTSAHLHICIPAALHRELKVRAAREGTTLSALVVAALTLPAPPAVDVAPTPPTFIPEEIVGRAVERHR